MRTTIDVDSPVLQELKRVAKREKKTIGALLSELLADALARRRRGDPAPQVLVWHTTQGGLRVDLNDKQRLWELLDKEQLGQP